MSSSSGVTLGSAKITIPSGFTSVTITGVTASAGKDWNAWVASGKINLEADHSWDELSRGQSVWVTFSAIAPGVAGTYEWTTEAWGCAEPFTIIPPQPTVTVSAPLPPTKILVDPPTTTVHACEEFTVDINIEDVVDLYSWEVFISFDPAAVDYVDVAYGPFLTPPKVSVYPPAIGVGYIGIGECKLMPPGDSGSGTLATVTFHCLAPINTDLHLYGTLLLDSCLLPIPHDTEDGYVTQLPALTYSVIFDATATSPLPDVDDETVIVTGDIGGAPFEVKEKDLPATFSGIASGTWITYAFTDPVPCTVSGKQLRLDSITGPASPFQVAGDTTITGNYVVQYYVTFDQTGVGSDFTGTVMTIDGTDYDRSGASFWWDENSVHTFSFASPLVPLLGKQYVWTSTTGLSTLQSDTLTITASGSVTGNYKTQLEVSFDHIGLDPTSIGTVVTVTYIQCGTTYTDVLTYSDLPYSIWADVDTWVYYTFETLVGSNVPGKQFILDHITGAPSPIYVQFPIGLYAIGWYKTQYYLTVLTFPEGLQPTPTPQSGWYDECTYVTLTAPSTAHIGNIVYTFGCWQINGKLGWAGENPVTIHMDSPKIACARYCELGDPIGDVNLDGKVNVIDIATIARHYGAKLGEPNYSVGCDLNLDGKIDLRDLAAAARNFS